MSNGMGITNYRGHTAVAPIAPYAFTSTPSLATPGQRQGPHLPLGAVPWGPQRLATTGWLEPGRGESIK